MRIISIIILLLINVFNQDLNAQSIIINSRPGNCVSCLKGMSLLDHKSYPIFMVFEESDLAYKNEIDSYYESFDVKIVFNNKLFNKTLLKNSIMPSIALLDERANKVFHVSIEQLNEDFVDKNITTYFEKLMNSSIIGSYDDVFYDNKYKYIFNYSFGILKIYERDKLIKTLTVDSLSLYDKVKNLNSIDSADIVYSDEKIKFESGVKPKFEIAVLDSKSNKTYLSFNLPYIRNKVIENLNSIQYLVVLDTLLKVELYKIELPDGYAKYSNAIYPLNDTSLIFNLYNDSLERVIENDYSVKMPYLAKYRLEEMKLKFDSLYNIDLPNIHKTKYKNNYLTSLPWHYPYAIQIFSNAIVNLEKGTSVNVIPDSLYNEYLSTKEFGHFVINKVIHNTDKKEVLCFYKIDKSYYVNKYNERLKLLDTYQLETKHFMEKVSYRYNDTDKTIGVYVDNYKRLFLPIEVF